jgi:TIP41-like family
LKGSLSQEFEDKTSLAKETAAKLNEEKALNMIDLLPERIEVKDSAVWKKKDMSKVKDFKQIEVISDWTYSTPYKGSVLRISSGNGKRVFLETSLQFPSIAGMV